MNEPQPDALPSDLLDAATAQFEAVSDAERDAVCEALVCAHPQHAAALRRLLRRIRGAERLLDGSFPPPPVDVDPAAIAGHVVVRRLGEGAFGTVYLCRQEEPVARLVAIKVIRPGHGEGDLLRRFHAERQVLASLNHPAIAQVYDAGALPDGRPYFVMEFVDGLPITHHARSRSPSAEQCLRLFVQVCRGVDHAHGRGVVHRDLKPGNVLVAESGDAAQPKIIDFGIAKLLLAGGSSDAVVARTETGRVMGTPGYMSPEQAAGRVDEIDARTDVFALGVMLYELLTGDLPWPRGALHETATDPALPSVRITKNARRKPGADTTSARRRAAAVRGDLDWITLKALRRERDERYRTARDLADDLERHLEGRPVHAARPTLGYRLRKVYRRHRVATCAVAGALLVAGAALCFATWRTHTAEAKSWHDVQRLADGLLQRANDAAMIATPRNEAVRAGLAGDALAAYDEHVAARPDDPSLRARRVRALATLSEVHCVLGKVSDASRTADEAANEAEALLASAPGDVALRALFADATRRRVHALQLAQDFRSSLPLCRRAVADLERCAAADSRAHTVALAQALRELSLAQQVLGDVDASVAAGSRSVRVLEQSLASVLPAAGAANDLVWARFVLAGQLTDARRFDEAEAQLAEAETGLPEVTSERDRLSAVVYCQQGRLAWQRGDVDAALPRLQRGVAACEAWLQEEPNQVRAKWSLFEAVLRLARAQEAKGDWATATATMARAIELADAKGASFAEDPERVNDVRATAHEFGRALWNRTRRSDVPLAATWLRRCLALTDAAVAAKGSQRPLAWEAKAAVALVGDSAGEPTDAQWDDVAAALPSRRELGAEEPAQQVVEGWLGVVRSRLRRGDVAGARAALDESAHYLGEQRDVDTKLRSEACYWRARTALAANDFAAVDAASTQLLELRPSWWGHWRAGDVAFAAWQKLAAEQSADAAAWRERAMRSYRAVVTSLAEQVEREPNDPWPVVPWGFCSVGLAILEADSDDDSSRPRIDAALQALARVEAEAHRDLWDASRIADARALARR